MFDTEGFRMFLGCVALNEFKGANDIAIFLDSEFKRIRASPRYRHIRFPLPWPEPGVVDELVQKADGQFIFATTVVKFIDDEYSSPCKQLERVLGSVSSRDPVVVSPYHDLDLLYHQVLASNPQYGKVLEILRAIVSSRHHNGYNCRYTPHIIGLIVTPAIIEELLELEDGEVITNLRGMHSVLHIGGPQEPLYILHASFSEFLTDEHRAQNFYIGGIDMQRAFLASCFAQVIKRYAFLDHGSNNTLHPAQKQVLDHAWQWWGGDVWTPDSDYWRALKLE
ncbi:hypothetical protein VNI00_007048 [Paramarasmius palmivorus]|uniref:Uncharacterized protein n=1 Tax=Paramarasmius palmivorus TaxID=297713 RepID=A0AAW0D5I3_9AGAR